MRILTKIAVGGIVAHLFLVSGAMASTKNSSSSLRDHLLRFHNNTSSVMDELPPFISDKGKLQYRGSVVFDSEQVEAAIAQHRESQDWVIERSVKARAHKRAKLKTLSKPLEDDQPLDLIYSDKVVSNLFELYRAGVDTGETDFKPWSDSYWPTYRGIIAARYADPAYPNSSDWLKNFNYSRSRPAPSYIPGQMNQLSPAEKYDLLTANSLKGLADHVWKKGEASYRAHGRVAKWMGICHGWAAASHMNIPTPKKSVVITGVNGHRITFYPSDVKGLVSYLWAESSPSTRFIGNRCRITNPAKDHNGRIIDQACFDSNPASWHLVITNQIGLLRKSFVMDSTYDTEVWNYPVQKYKVTYFDPQSLRPTQNPRAAIRPISEFRLDKFSSYRNPEAKFVVGVAMDVTHPGPAQPTTGQHGEEPLVSKTIRYVYDLELDAKYNIIGGEWYSNIHPDFLWTFEPDGKALSRGDLSLSTESWDPATPLPKHWGEVAAQDAGRGKVLSKIVNKILDASQTPRLDEGP